MIDQDWISVKDRLPDKNGEYLCFYSWREDFDYYKVFNFLHTAYETKVMTWNAPKDAKITHWMPLPEPPFVIDVRSFFVLAGAGFMPIK